MLFPRSEMNNLYVQIPSRVLSLTGRAPLQKHTLQKQPYKAKEKKTILLPKKGGTHYI